MNKQEAIYELEYAIGRIQEADETIRNVIQLRRIRDVDDLEILEKVTDILKLLQIMGETLSKIKMKKSKEEKMRNIIPVEGMYKCVYYDWKKALTEQRRLQKDIETLMAEKGWTTDVAELQLKQIRAEREIEKLDTAVSNKDEEIKKIKRKYDALSIKMKKLRRKSLEMAEEELKNTNNS